MRWDDAFSAGQGFETAPTRASGRFFWDPEPLTLVNTLGPAVGSESCPLRLSHLGRRALEQHCLATSRIDRVLISSDPGTSWESEPVPGSQRASPSPSLMLLPWGAEQLSPQCRGPARLLPGLGMHVSSPKGRERVAALDRSHPLSPHVLLQPLGLAPPTTRARS